MKCDIQNSHIPSNPTIRPPTQIFISIDTWCGLAAGLWLQHLMPGVPAHYHMSPPGGYTVRCHLRILLMEDTEGMEAGSHTRWASSCSRISHANRPGLSVLMRMILFTTEGVATCCKHDFLKSSNSHNFL